MDDAASLVHFEPLSALWLDTLLPIEEQAYAHPWSRGNFQDAMVAGYEMQLLVDANHQLLGYFVAMSVLDEVHLLNITVNPAHQRQGWHACCWMHWPCGRGKRMHSGSGWKCAKAISAPARSISSTASPKWACAKITTPTPTARVKTPCL